MSVEFRSVTLFCRPTRLNTHATTALDGEERRNKQQLCISASRQDGLPGMGVIPGPNNSTMNDACLQRLEEEASQQVRRSHACQTHMRQFCGARGAAPMIISHSFAVRLLSALDQLFIAQTAHILSVFFQDCVRCYIGPADRVHVAIRSAIVNVTH